MNAIKGVVALWQNGGSLSTVRLFVDFHVPQQIIQNYGIEATRNDAFSFAGSVSRAVGLKPYDATMTLLGLTVHCPIVVLHASHGIRRCLNGDDNMKLPGIELSRSVYFSESAASVASLVVNDLLSLVVDLSKETVFKNIIADVLEFGSPLAFDVVVLSPQLTRTLEAHDIPVSVNIDFRLLREQLTLQNLLSLAKRFSASVFLTRYGSSKDLEAQRLAPEFFARCLNATLASCDQPSTVVLDMCEELFWFFRSLAIVWRLPPPPTATIALILKILVQDIPGGRSIAFVVLHTVTAVPAYSPIHALLANLPKLWIAVVTRDLVILSILIDKEGEKLRFVERYAVDSAMRLKMHRALVHWHLKADLGEYLKFIPSFQV
jgi:hypothetical protein